MCRSVFVQPLFPGKDSLIYRKSAVLKMRLPPLPYFVYAHPLIRNQCKWGQVFWLNLTGHAIQTGHLLCNKHNKWLGDLIDSCAAALETWNIHITLYTKLLCLTVLKFVCDQSWFLRGGIFTSDRCHHPLLCNLNSVNSVYTGVYVASI